ncbi:MAG: aspartate carbamoyltransferase [Thermoprotei archaeon]|nr:MAG: aspartate carbamoyltransferase [Thermoprotei archaeon]
MGFKGRDVLSILDFRRDELETLFKVADDIRADPLKYSEELKGFVLATAFFEPSTRTRLSFQTSILRLGGSYIDLGEMKRSSIAKGENIADTVKMLDAYADVIVIRHRIEGTAKFAAEIAESPVINAGDGRKHHPTQAMIDLYSIYTFKGGIDGLNVAVMGDLKYGRAATSLILGLTLFKPKTLYLISPPELRIRPEVMEYLKRVKINFIEITKLEDCISELDVLYVTRIQKERFPDPAEYEKVRGSYRITLENLKEAKDDLIILHPLPKVGEIDLKVDKTRFAKYFEQAALGVPIRMALLKLIVRG